MDITAPQTRRNFLALGAVSGASALLSACGLATAAQTPGASQRSNLYLTIVTPDETGKKDFPAYIPAYFSLPAHATVQVQILNFDDATPLAKGTEQFAKVAGTVGNQVKVEPIDPGNPNDPTGGAQVISEMDPSQVSHTFSITRLGINVPVTPKALTTFTLQTGAPGTYDWRCMDPCGTGDSGWGGPMATPGYMAGKLTIE